MRRYLLATTIFLHSVLFSFCYINAAELLFLGDFETGDIQSPTSNPDGWTDQSCYSYSTTVVNSPVRAGNYAAKIHLEASEVVCFENGIPRAQLVKDVPDEMNLDVQEGRWFAYSVYYPEEDWPETGYMSIMSVFGNLYHKVETGGAEIIHVRWGTGAGQTPDGTEDVYDEPLTKGVWTDWVFYYYPSYESDGVLKVWKNGNLIVDREGANCIQGFMGWTNVRIKLYGNDHQEFTIYFDEFRMASGPDTQEYYDLVDPAQGGSVELSPPINVKMEIIP